MFKYLLVLSTLLLAFGCTPKVGTTAIANGAVKSVNYDQTETLAPGQRLRVEKQSPAFTFLEVISDNRCPQGVNCIQAGEAIIRLRVGDEEREFVIPAYAESKDLPRFTVPAGSVSLLGLEPYPVARVKTAPEAYRLRLVVIKASVQ